MRSTSTLLLGVGLMVIVGGAYWYSQRQSLNAPITGQSVNVGQ